MSATKHISRLSNSFNHKTTVSVLRQPPQVMTPSIHLSDLLIPLFLPSRSPWKMKMRDEKKERKGQETKRKEKEIDGYTGASYSWLLGETRKTWRRRFKHSSLLRIHVFQQTPGQK